MAIALIGTTERFMANEVNSDNEEISTGMNTLGKMNL